MMCFQFERGLYSQNSLVVLTISLLFWGAPTVANESAGFRVCNGMHEVTNVAVGRWGGENWVTEGWWVVGPGQCATVHTGTDATRYNYVFAQDVHGRTMLSGTTRMCVRPTAFVISQQSDCIAQGHVPALFTEVDTTGVPDWTVFLTPAEPF